jgi:hypothetical protein
MSQTHLLRRDGRYYFRRKIPRDVRRWFAGRGEIRKSLKTESLALARSLVKFLSFRTEKVFTLIRSGMMTAEQIIQLVEEYTDQTLRETEEARSRGHFLPRDPEDLDEMLETHSFLLTDAREALVMGSVESVEHVAKHLIEERGLSVAQGSPEYKSLCRELLKSTVRVLTIEIERLKGNYDNPYDRRWPSTTPLQPGTVSGKTGNLLSKLIREYVEETAGSGRWIPKSRAEAEAIYDLFLRFVGEREIGTLSHRVLVEYRETLRKLPSNLKKNPRYREKSVAECWP